MGLFWVSGIKLKNYQIESIKTHLLQFSDFVQQKENCIYSNFLGSNTPKMHLRSGALPGLHYRASLQCSHRPSLIEGGGRFAAKGKWAEKGRQGKGARRKGRNGRDISPEIL